MDIRYNINRIHSNLMSKFENVDIFEKSSLDMGQYFEIRIMESKEVRIIIPYRNVDNKSTINWFYRSNPLNESSDLIPRSSTVDNIDLEIVDIIDNNRFSEDYLNK